VFYSSLRPPVRDFPVIPQAVRAEQVPIPGRSASWQHKDAWKRRQPTGVSSPAAWSSRLSADQHTQEDRPVDTFGVLWSPAMAAKGFAIFEAGDFDLLILDTFMPEWTGWRR
jgi:hypothetical protein